MSTSSVRIAAKPEDVYRELTQSLDDIEPGPLKVGDLFAQSGKSEVFTITAVEPPRRFGFSAIVGDVTTKAEYTIAPDGDGSMVSVEMDQDSPANPLMVMLYGLVMEGRNERSILTDLKTRIEQVAPKTPSTPAQSSAPTSSATAEARQPCPQCGESIAQAAKVCRFCGHELAAGEGA